MEPAFELEYMCGWKMLAEFQRKLGTGPRYLTMVLIVLAFFVIWVYSWLAGVWEEVRGFFIGMGLFEIFLFSMPCLTAWGNLYTTKKLNGTVTRTRITVGDTIQSFEGMVHLTIEYAKIRRVVRLKHSYVLMLGWHNGLLLDPDGFTKGTFQEFKQFLREKRPDLQIPE